MRAIDATTLKVPGRSGFLRTIHHSGRLLAPAYYFLRLTQAEGPARESEHDSLRHAVEEEVEWQADSMFDAV